MRTYRVPGTATATTTARATAIALALGTALTTALALAAPATAAAAAAAAAGSASAYVDGDNTVHYKAAAGQTNHLTVGTEPGGEDYVITFRDRVGITAGPGCDRPVPADLTYVRCTTSGHGMSSDEDIYTVDLGDRDDTAGVAANNSAYASIRGGSGDDVLLGTEYDVLYGQDGNDRIDSGGGVWGLGSYGGAGRDTLTGCSMACHGGSGDDTLTGTDGRTGNALYGDSGDDTLRARSGADVLYGGKGADRLYGDHGDDRLYGQSGDDRLYGGQGRDTLSGGPGRDILRQD